MKIIQIIMLILAFSLMLSGALSSSFAQEPPYIDFLETCSRTIRIDGLVENPINVTLQELIEMPAVQVPAVLFCLNTLVVAGVWTGPQLSLLLEMAELDSNATALRFYADDGYSSYLTIEQAMEEDVIIAYAIDDQPLPELRLVVPGENGDVWIAMLNHIQADSYTPVTEPPPEMNPAPAPSPSPSPSPTPEPSPSNPVESSDTAGFPLVWIVAAVGAATIVGAILIVYKKKSEK